MSQEDSITIKNSYLSSFISLFASTSTLVCCALPALLVSLGAGAALASLVSVFPQIVWVSENKELIFMFSSLLMLIGGLIQFKNRYAPCPIDPELRQACLKTRNLSLGIYLISLFLLMIGGWFAFIQPLL